MELETCYAVLFLALFSHISGVNSIKVVEPSCRVITDQGELDLSPLARKDAPA